MVTDGKNEFPFRIIFLTKYRSLADMISAELRTASFPFTDCLSAVLRRLNLYFKNIMRGPRKVKFCCVVAREPSA